MERQTGMLEIRILHVDATMQIERESYHAKKLARDQRSSLLRPERQRRRKKGFKRFAPNFFLFRAVAFFITNPRGENVPANSFGISNPDNSLQGPVM